MKYIGMILKFLPLITLVTGIMSGGARLKPFLDTVKVALTQYELGQITKLVFDDLQRNETPIDAAKFPEFVRDTYHNQYSVLAREIKGDQSHDHAQDIWGKLFQLDYNQAAANIKIFSAGPDGEYNTKDDIAADIGYESAPPQLAKKEAPKQIMVQESEVVEVAEQPVEEAPVEDNLYPETEEQVGNVDAPTEAFPDEAAEQREPAADIPEETPAEAVEAY